MSRGSGEPSSRGEVEPPSVPSTHYLNCDDECDGPKPSELYGKFTWKIDNFSEISKKELRSNVFEVGGYKWYILVYPQGCDVCNHLSLFLCVADYDKLLPGWSHFAQFTIAVVNKDPKKSKYSDTLHRFCKKEHDWGWKKFMELSKVVDGFTVSDTLVIKAQVQVIREHSGRPFRCLDCQYRRELARVYLTNVEGICRRFLEEKREALSALRADKASFRAFWVSQMGSRQRQLTQGRSDVILKAIVKRFFNEKEQVTSTLVMDALYSGYRALDLAGDCPEAPVCLQQDYFYLGGDVLGTLERAATDVLPASRPGSANAGGHYGGSRVKDDGLPPDENGRDSMERDEQWLAELGRRTVEMFVLAHLFCNNLETAYRESVALKRQEALIREEEEAEKAESEKTVQRGVQDHKRSKKKLAKQRRKDRKEREAEERLAKQEEKQRMMEQEERERQRLLRLDKKAREKAQQQQRKSRKPSVFAGAGEGEGADVGLEGEADTETDGPGGASAAETQSQANGDGSGSSEGGDGDADEADGRSSGSTSACSSPLSFSGNRPAAPAAPIENGSSDLASAHRPAEPPTTIPAETRAYIRQLKAKVRWLEQRLNEKEDEVTEIQKQLEVAIAASSLVDAEDVAACSSGRAEENASPVAEIQTAEVQSQELEDGASESAPTSGIASSQPPTLNKIHTHSRSLSSGSGTSSASSAAAPSVPTNGRTVRPESPSSATTDASQSSRAASAPSAVAPSSTSKAQNRPSSSGKAAPGSVGGAATVVVTAGSGRPQTPASASGSSSATGAAGSTSSVEPSYRNAAAGIIRTASGNGTPSGRATTAPAPAARNTSPTGTETPLDSQPGNNFGGMPNGSLDSMVGPQVVRKEMYPGSVNMVHMGHEHPGMPPVPPFTLLRGRRERGQHPVGADGSGLPDEFPHLSLINDLLDEDPMAAQYLYGGAQMPGMPGMLPQPMLAGSPYLMQNGMGMGRHAGVPRAVMTGNGVMEVSPELQGMGRSADGNAVPYWMLPHAMHARNAVSMEAKFARFQSNEGSRGLMGNGNGPVSYSMALGTYGSPGQPNPGMGQDSVRRGTH
eukprot:jgi/Chlat1/536/Chrsp103S01120